MTRALCLATMISGLLGHGSIVSAWSRDAPPDVPADPIEMDAPWVVLDGCLDDPPRRPEDPNGFESFALRKSSCAEAVATVVAAGTEADRERLWSWFDALPVETSMTGDIVEAFLDRSLELALAKLDGRPGLPAREPVMPTLEAPTRLRHAPDELQQAWRLYESVAQAQRKALEGTFAEAAVLCQSNEPAFHRVVAAFLRGRVAPADVVRDVSRSGWMGSCGTGSEALYRPKAKVLLLAHLQLGRVDLALLSGSGGLMEIEDAMIGADPRLLAAAGIDWERFYLGGVLSDRMELSILLGRRGSNRAARSLLAYAQLLGAAGEDAPAETLESLLWPLAAFVEPGDADTSASGLDSREVGPRAADAEPIDADVQERVLDLLAASVAPDAGRGGAQVASHLLGKLGRPESRPAFHAMLQSPFEEVRNTGVAGLRALGETVADTLPSPPVSFRVVVDGRPAENRALSWLLETEDGGGESNVAQTDGAGVVQIPRDGFVDPRRPVVSVELRASELKAADGEWFDVELRPLPDLDVVATVSIRTGVLTVVIPPSLLECSPAPRVSLIALVDADDDGLDGQSSYGNARLMSAQLPVSSTRLTFPHLQHGRYQVWLDCGREGAHSSPPVEVGVQLATTTVSVDPAYSADEEPEERDASPTNQPL